MTTRLKILLIIFAVSVMVLGVYTFNQPGVINALEDVFDKPQKTKVTTSSQTKQPIITKTSAVTEPVPRPTNMIHNIGENFEFDKFSYTVNSAVNKGQNYDYSETSGKYIEILMTAENIGKISAKPHAIVVVDNEQRQFTVNQFIGAFDSDGYEAYTKYMILGDKIQPGFTTKLRAVFEVSNKSTGLQLLFADSNGKVLQQVRLGM